jgi:hypothetical protein
MKTQGLCQGNGALPAGWAVISICILRACGEKGHGAKFLCPITKLQQHLLAISYVNDTDILHIDLTKDESVDEVHTAIQGSVNSWGKLLIATGRVLQPQKCLYSVISFDWKNGEWQYAQNATRDNLQITVPLPDGSSAMISHKKVSQAKKTLGAMTSPDGNSTASILMMQEKAQDWINAVQSGNMHRCNVWFFLKVQFWPRVGYGLCSSMATLHELDNVLHQQYFQILPLGRVVQTTTVESRTINAVRNRGAGRVNEQTTDALRLQHTIGDSQLCFLRFDSIRTQPCACWMAALTITRKPTGFYNRIYKGVAFLFVN